MNAALVRQTAGDPEEIMATKHGWLPPHLLITPLLVDEQGVLVCQFSIELLQLTAQGKKNKLSYRNCDLRFQVLTVMNNCQGSL